MFVQSGPGMEIGDMAGIFPTITDSLIKKECR